MTLTLRIIAGIFAAISTLLFKYGHNNTGLLSAILAIVSLIAALFTNKNRKTKKGGDTMKTTGKTIIGKKVVVKIGGKPPKDNPNEIVGDSTIVHVSDDEVGKHKKIVGVESKVIIGDPEEKNKE